MKKAVFIILSLICAASISLVGGCFLDSPADTPKTPDSQTSGNNGGNNNGGTPLSTFTGITFADKTVEYNGSEQTITVSGNIPTGAEVVYTGNKGTNVGEYNASVTISKAGYTTLTLNAKLTIRKATFTGIELNNRTFGATGAARSIAINGTLPAGSQVTYENNSNSAVGEYTVTATITNPNYNSLTLTATVKIVNLGNLVNLALNTLNELLVKPDMWSYMPQAFAGSNMKYAESDITADFTSNVQVSAIKPKIIGKQFNVFYSGIASADVAVGYMDKLISGVSTIAGLYQTFINDNPEEFKTFTGEALGFKFKINLIDDKSEILIGNSVVSMELTCDKASGLRMGRIQVTDGIALKYESTNSSIKFSLKATVAGVGILKQIELTRSEASVSGYLREFVGTATKNLKTSAGISIDSEYTRIMSNKRETDDLLIKGYEEVYSSATGKFIGAEVQENVKSIDYDTLWFMLGDVSGINSIKVMPEQNGLNADIIFVNNSETSIKIKTWGGLTAKTASRRYDIEMKDVWYVVATTDENGKVKYDTKKYSIPMLFVQIEKASEFSADIREKNTNIVATLPDYAAVTAKYAQMQKLFNDVKELITYAEIDAAVGTKNSFFVNTVN